MKIEDKTLPIPQHVNSDTTLIHNDYGSMVSMKTTCVGSSSPTIQHCWCSIINSNNQCTWPPNKTMEMVKSPHTNVQTVKKCTTSYSLSVYCLILAK